MKILITPYRKLEGEIMHRQTKNSSLKSLDGRYEFVIGYPEDGQEYDFWVVQSKGLRREAIGKVAPENTILLSTEPYSVLEYPTPYIKQFGVVCTCQEQTKHKNLLLSPPILPWFIGYSDLGDQYKINLDYDSLIQNTPIKKTKLISVITSNKAFTQGHIDRIAFVKKLKAYFGDDLDVFGRGFNTFDDKFEVLAPYKYHVVIENCSQNYYWTEKLSDVFLAESFPIYYGCKNIEKYFSKDSMKVIDIHNFEQSVDVIKNAIDQDLYQKQYAELLKAKELVLNKYNMFEYIAGICDRLDPKKPKTSVRLLPCKSSQSWHNVWNYTIARSYYEFKHKILY